jgi:hypothetical protein
VVPYSKEVVTASPPVWTLPRRRTDPGENAGAVGALMGSELADPVDPAATSCTARTRATVEQAVWSEEHASDSFRAAECT